MARSIERGGWKSGPSPNQTQITPCSSSLFHYQRERGNCYLQWLYHPVLHLPQPSAESAVADQVYLLTLKYRVKWQLQCLVLQHQLIKFVWDKLLGFHASSTDSPPFPVSKS